MVNGIVSLISLSAFSLLVYRNAELVLLNYGVGEPLGLWRVPWTEKKSNWSFLKEINPKYSLEGLILKLKHQYFGHLLWRASSLEKTLMLGKIEGRRRRGQQKMRWLDSITDSMDMSVSKLQETVKERGALCPAAHGIEKNQTQLSNWTTKKGKLLTWFNWFNLSDYSHFTEKLRKV